MAAMHSNHTFICFVCVAKLLENNLALNGKSRNGFGNEMPGIVCSIKLTNVDWVKFSCLGEEWQRLFSHSFSSHHDCAWLVIKKATHFDI
jgi:hypothetical protein